MGSALAGAAWLEWRRCSVVVLGNVGLQQTMSLGPLMPDGAIVAYGAMGLVATVAGYLGAPGATVRSAAPGIVALLVIDLVGATVATFLIGELGLVDLPAVRGRDHGRRPPAAGVLRGLDDRRLARIRRLVARTRPRRPRRTGAPVRAPRARDARIALPYSAPWTSHLSVGSSSA